MKKHGLIVSLMDNLKSDDEKAYMDVYRYFDMKAGGVRSNQVYEAVYVLFSILNIASHYQHKDFMKFFKLNKLKDDITDRSEVIDDIEERICPILCLFERKERSIEHIKWTIYTIIDDLKYGFEGLYSVFLVYDSLKKSDIDLLNLIQSIEKDIIE